MVKVAAVAAVAGVMEPVAVAAAVQSLSSTRSTRTPAPWWALAGAAASTPTAATMVTASPVAPPRRTSVVMFAVTGVLPSTPNVVHQ